MEIVAGKICFSRKKKLIEKKLILDITRDIRRNEFNIRLIYEIIYLNGIFENGWMDPGFGKS